MEIRAGTRMLLVLCLLPPVGAIAAAEDVPPVHLPADPNAVVISLDYRGGYPPPRPPFRPYLEILADGTALARNPRSLAVATDRGELRAQEVQDLLRFAIRDCRFFEVDANRLRKSIEEHLASKDLFRTHDADDIILRVRTRDRTHEIRIPPVGPASGKPWPDDEQLILMKSMHALVWRLERVYARTVLSDEQELAEYLRIANEHLLSQHPNVPELQAKHLSNVRRDGSQVLATFYRRDDGSDSSVNVTVERQTEGLVEVHISNGK